MSMIREAENEIRQQIFLMRHEGGVQAVRSWVTAEQARTNMVWPGALGEELYRLQGESRLLAKLLKLIDTSPTIKQPTGGNNG